MKYVYGPVKSRRLGFSLGITTVPYKVCSFDCVYCQLNKTTNKTSKRGEYIDSNEILYEIKEFFENKPKNLLVDCITFSGSGEPTLNIELGRLIEDIKKITSLPIVLITNSSLFASVSVRNEAKKADLIIPSLDAVTQDIFKKIDRPDKDLRIKDIINGLIEFKKVFNGRMWLEVMLVRGMNDSVSYLKKIKKIVDKINPDRVQINMPVRVPAEHWVLSPEPGVFKKAKEIFGDKCDIVVA